MIYDYLEGRENLVNTFVLLDSRLDLQKIDLDFINWLGSKGIPFSIIYTKIDGVSNSKKFSQVENIQSALLEYWEELPRQFVTSSVKKEGRDDIIDYIMKINESLDKS